MSSNISETEQVTKNLTTGIIITPKVLVVSQNKNILPYPFNNNLLITYRKSGKSKYNRKLAEYDVVN